ncbi:hypothetical protein CR159_08375 [Pollutimonas subterranea]|uniref:OmpR/PhoB-type domain-containing protein n=1 Tax=Pollutimonas subterranea TaxID=2045210 RepID=A0A2N4U613_9BURK|nr:helix-turn-helix domain-containing protein [Pollutimonas subterranea]PLC50450.1 hypothetical protein CR159_08375 [Pollutimonas subterranea]
MTPAPTVLVLNERPAKASQHHIAQLQGQGYIVIVCADLQALCEMAAQYRGQVTTPWVILLASSLVNNCMAANRLRKLFPSVGILALVTSGTEAVLTHTLHSGADNYCRYSASAALFMATLHPLVARAAAVDVSLDAAVPVPDVPAAQGHWALTEWGWVITGPQQQRIRLTAVERAFLAALFAAPGLRANHGRLLGAINSSCADNAPPYRHARLALLVSRLRRKFRTQGCVAPIQSVHRWGYMFTGRVSGQP